MFVTTYLQNGLTDLDVICRAQSRGTHRLLIKFFNEIADKI